MKFGMVHAMHPSAGRMKMPTMAKLPKPGRIHPAAQPGVRIPQGEVNTKAGDPGVFMPGIGRI